MSIAAVGGTNPYLAPSQVTNQAKPEAAETPGMPDHDGDSDDTSATAAPGRFNTYA